MGATCPMCQEGEFDAVDSHFEDYTLVQEEICDQCGAQVILTGEVGKTLDGENLD